MKNGGATHPSDLRVDDFNTVSEALKFFIAKIPISRIRGLVKHAKNEFQVVTAAMLSGETLPPDNREKMEKVDPIYNFLTLESDIMSTPKKKKRKYDTTVYTIPVARAFHIVKDSMSQFVRNSKLIDDFIRLFRVKRKVYGSNEDNNSSFNKSGGREEDDVMMDNDSGDDDLAVDDVPEVEIVCDDNDGDIKHDGAYDEDVEVEVPDLFGTKTILKGKNRSEKCHEHTPKRSVSVHFDDGVFEPDSDEYLQLVEAFALSSTAIIISQVSRYVLVHY